MSPDLILQIVKLSLEIALEIIKHIPKEQHVAFWEQHRKNMEFWQDLFQKVQAKP